MSRTVEIATNAAERVEGENPFQTILKQSGNAGDLVQWLTFCDELVRSGVPYSKIPAIFYAFNTVGTQREVYAPPYWGYVNPPDGEESAEPSKGE